MENILLNCDVQLLSDDFGKFLTTPIESFLIEQENERVKSNNSLLLEVFRFEGNLLIVSKEIGFLYIENNLEQAKRIAPIIISALHNEIKNMDISKFNCEEKEFWKRLSNYFKE